MRKIIYKILQALIEIIVIPNFKMVRDSFKGL